MSKYKFYFTRGTLLDNIYITPAIMFEQKDVIMSWLTLNWGIWFIGFKIINLEEERKFEKYLEEKENSK